MAAEGKSTEANLAFDKAFQTRTALYPDDQLSIGRIQERDYDDMVIFWSR